MRTMTLTAALGVSLVLAGCSVEDEPGSTTTTTDDTGTAGATTDTGGATEDAASTEDAAATEDAASTDAAAGTDAAPMADEVCAGFFQNVPVTLAQRADDARTALEDGAVADPASWAEVNLLKQRVEDLAADADADQGALLERLNAPFEEASSAVLEDPEKSPTDEEITLPEIDVDDSRAAQEEFLAACSG